MEKQTELEPKKKILKGDRYIWGVYFILCMVSIIEIYSASSTLTYKVKDYFGPAIRHTAILLAGTGVVFLVHNLHYRWFKGLWLILIPLSVVLLVYTMFFGEVVNDSQRWIKIMGISVQPSEFAKLGAITFIAYILAKNQLQGGVHPNTFMSICIPVGVLSLLILPENFSTTMLLGLVCFCMMLIGRVELRKLLSAVGVLFLLVLVIIFVAPRFFPDSELLSRAKTWENRIERFTEGSDVPKYMEKTNDKNFQEHHARMAIANGGVFGKFPGNSRERDFLPQAYSDFIFAIIIEEMGFIGGLGIMALYLSLLIRAGMIAKKCTRAFPAFLIMGTALLIVFQAIVNMSVAVGLIPVTGQPLPLISRGGTSTIFTCIYFGIMLSISRFATEEGLKKEGNSAEANVAIPVDISAPNPNIME